MEAVEEREEHVVSILLVAEELLMEGLLSSIEGVRSGGRRVAVLVIVFQSRGV